MKNDKMQNKMVKALDGTCPCFRLDPSGGPALWHQCKCTAREDGNCLCVWHSVSTCDAGQWTELAFVDASKASEAVCQISQLELAKTACKG